MVRFVLIAIFTFLLIPMSIQAKILFQDNFDSYTDSPLNHGWSSIGSNVSIVSNEGYNRSRCIQVKYSEKGTTPYVLSWNGISSYKANEIYVRFYYKVIDYHGGSKFLKFFGKKEDGYANTTIPIEGVTEINYIRYGDGSSLENDTQTYIRFDGNTSDPSVKTLVSDKKISFDDSWHSFEVFFKYNSNGQRDGEYKIWKDGNLILHATNVKNRHDSNLPILNSIDFANYTGIETSYYRYLMYDNIVISDEYIGPLDDKAVNSPPTSPPTIAVTK